MEFVIDLAGQLWRGPSHPERNLHWERLDGKRADGSPVWHLCRATRPLGSSPISPEEARRLIDEMPGEA